MSRIDVELMSPEQQQLLIDALKRVALGSLVAARGTLIVIARAREPGQPVDGPPLALTRAEIDALTEGGLEPVRIEDLTDTQMP